MNIYRVKRKSSSQNLSVSMILPYYPSQFIYACACTRTFSHACACMQAHTHTHTHNKTVAGE